MEHDQKEFNPQQEVQQPQMEAQMINDQQEVNDMVYFLELLQHLRAIANRAKAIPMSNHAIINLADYTQILDDIDQNLPDAIQYGMQMYDEKARILGEAEQAAFDHVASAEMKAQRALERAKNEARQIVQEAQEEANGIIEDAEERANFLISESEIVNQAREEAYSIKSEARVAANELRYKVGHDVQRMMSEVEERLNETLKEVRNLHSVIAKDEE